MSEPGRSVEDPSSLTGRLLRNLSIARTVVLLVILLALNLPVLLSTLEYYPAPVIGLVPFAGLLAVAVADAVVVARRSDWGWARLPVSALVLAIATAASAVLPPAELVRPAHWTLGAVGWFGVVLWAGRGLRPVVVFLVVHVLLMVVLLVLGGRADGATAVDLIIVVVAVSASQVAMAAAGSALREVSAEATTAAVAAAAAATGEAVAIRVHDDRAGRYARLRAGVLPLLRGIRTGTSPASDPSVQRRAAVEAARMRRLFALDDDTDDPLELELGALLDVVERRGLAVRLAAGPLPAPLPVAVRQVLLDVVGEVLMSATGTARVTLGAAGDDVVLGVVVRSAGVTVSAGGTRPVRDGTISGEVRTSVVTGEGRTWVEARWTSGTETATRLDMARPGLPS